MTREQKRIDAVIFDLDDTLIDWSQPSITWEEFTRPMADNLHNYLSGTGCTLPDQEEFFRLLGGHIQNLWEEAKKDWKISPFDQALRLTLTSCGLEAAAFDLEELMRIYGWGPLPGVELFEDALSVLDTLRQRGYKIGLITNSFLPMWMRDVELRHYNLIDYFDARLTSGDAGYLKPHPAIYHQMLSLLDTDAGRAVFVGDRPKNDIAGANEVGLISVLVAPPHLNRELDGVVPDYTITLLSELLSVLEALECGSEP